MVWSWFKVELEKFFGCCQPFVAEAASVGWKLLDHWLSYKTMTMLWCFGNFPVDFELVDLRRLSSFLQGRTSLEQDIRNWYTARLQNRLMSIRV